MKFLKFIAALIISFSAAALGSIATTPNIPTWYADLDKPFFNPPNWVFGPVWTVLYVLIGVSLYLLWTTPTSKSKRFAYIFFTAQLILNAAWSIVFFDLHQTWFALGIIIALITSIFLYALTVCRVSKAAAYLMIPYLLWVSFAMALNLAIAILN